MNQSSHDEFDPDHFAHQQVDDDLSFGATSADKARRMEHLATSYRYVAHQMVKATTPDRQRHEALRCLTESLMWACHAIAKDERDSPGLDDTLLGASLHDDWDFPQPRPGETALEALMQKRYDEALERVKARPRIVSWGVSNPRTPDSCRFIKVQLPGETEARDYFEVEP